MHTLAFSTGALQPGPHVYSLPTTGAGRRQRPGQRPLPAAPCPPSPSPAAGCFSPGMLASPAQSCTRDHGSGRVSEAVRLPGGRLVRMRARRDPENRYREHAAWFLRNRGLWYGGAGRQEDCACSVMGGRTRGRRGRDEELRMLAPWGLVLGKLAREPVAVKFSVMAVVGARALRASDALGFANRRQECRCFRVFSWNE